MSRELYSCLQVVGGHEREWEDRGQEKQGTRMDYETEVLFEAANVDLSGLFPGDTGPPSNPGTCVHPHHESAVLKYVTEVIEALQPLSDINLEPLCRAIFTMHKAADEPSEPMVTYSIMCAAIQSFLEPDVRKLYQAIPGFLPRALKTLNGPDFKLVPSWVLEAALDKEAVMRGTVHGWGTENPPVAAIAQRLLVASDYPGASCHLHHLESTHPRTLYGGMGRRV